MAEIINYIWQSSFCLLFFFGVYWCFLKDEKAFTLTRIFILIAPLMALLFPVVEIPVDFAKPSISLEHTGFLQTLSAYQEEEEIAGTFGLPEFTVSDSKLPLLLEFKDYLMIGYLISVLVLGLRLYLQFIQINHLLRKGWYQTTFQLKGDYFLVPTYGLAPVFSFFDKLFWDETQALSNREKDHIIQHEIEHIRQMHTWDIIYYQVISTLFWFNPAIHLMKSALVETHEYLADAKVLKGAANKDSYRQLIIKIAFRGLDLPIGNYFIRSTTLKRIMMMNKPSKINSGKLLMVLPLTGMLLALVSMKTMTEHSYLSQGMTAQISLIKKQIVSAQDSILVTTKVKRIPSPVHYEYVSGLTGGKIIAQLGNLQYEIGDISNPDEYRKVLEMVSVFKGNSSIQKNYHLSGLVTQADKMPEPVGGMEIWNKYLSQNLRFPPEARELGANGTVYAEFIVDKEGNILSPAIKKSLGMGLDDEVLRILALPSLPRWSPGENDGKPVSTLMTIPVRFKSVKNPEKPSFFATPQMSVPKDLLPDEDIFDVAEQMPIPSDGMEGWNTYLTNNLQYPKGAKEANLEGTVYVSFVVDKEGQILNPSILRGIGGGADDEALRVISQSPKWTAGMQHGQKVHVRMRLPIRFSLPDKVKDDPTADANESLDFPSTKRKGDLGEVVVIGYGSTISSGHIAKNLAGKNGIEIEIINLEHVLLNEIKFSMADLRDELSIEAQRMESMGIGKDQIIASIKASEKTKLGQIQDIQNILRDLGIRKISYSNF